MAVQRLLTHPMVESLVRRLWAAHRDEAAPEPPVIEVPVRLATPRLPAPRKHVPLGCVAIGGAQTGIYPLASPGGWRLIGRTPLALFDLNHEPPPLLRMGDHVRFVPLAEAGG